MYENINTRCSLMADKQGAVSVEFILVTLFIFLMLVTVARLAHQQTTGIKLQNMAYSIAGIVRERKSRTRPENITQAEVNELAKLAKKMLSTLPKNERDTFIMTVEQLNFKDIDTDKPFPGSFIRFHSPNNTIASCEANLRLTDPVEMNLSVKSNVKKRWIPLYRVNLCLEVAGLLPGSIQYSHPVHNAWPII